MNDYTQHPNLLASSPNTTSDKLLLRIGTAAELLDVSRSKLYSMINQGIVPAKRIGNSIRISVEDLAELDRKSAKRIRLIISHN